MKTKNQNYRTKLKIVFLGTHRLAQIVLEKLIDSQFKPQLVITGHDRKSGRGQILKSTPIKEIAQKNHLPVQEPKTLLDKDFVNTFRDFSPDLAILVAYGKIIPTEVLTIPKHGFLNIHPSLLPKYRGPSPIITAILEGETETGVTIIKLDEELDHGPIISQKAIKIQQSETTESLTGKLARIGAEQLIESLPDYLLGQIKLQEQDHSKATLTQKITKEDGFIDLAKPPDPTTLDRMIRAFYPWPSVWSKVPPKARLAKGGKVKSDKSIIIKFLPNIPTILQTYRPTNLPTYKPTDLFLIQPEGKRPMTIKEFLNGYPQSKDLIEKII